MQSGGAGRLSSGHFAFCIVNDRVHFLAIGLARVLRRIELPIAIEQLRPFRLQPTHEVIACAAFEVHHIRSDEPRAVVDGGWDALSVLAPFGTDHRHEAELAALRPGLSGAIDRTAAVPLSADPSLSWHPSAAGLRALWDDPTVGVAIAPAIGYAKANYSHFTSRHFWEIGALDTGGTTGWLGRYLDRVGRPDVPVQPVTIDGYPHLTQGALPGQHVSVDRVYQRAVEIENYSVHTTSPVGG